MFLINSFKANIVSYVDTDKKNEVEHGHRHGHGHRHEQEH
jgi:hypothetical protein